VVVREPEHQGYLMWGNQPAVDASELLRNTSGPVPRYLKRP
jgi:hypothetical protein